MFLTNWPKPSKDVQSGFGLGNQSVLRGFKDTNMVCLEADRAPVQVIPQGHNSVLRL